MFERFCALLLRIYPAGFRRAYGRESAQLIRDRARHERGVFRRARLLVDLAIDLCATWRHGWQLATPLVARMDGTPRFDIIEVHGPHPAALAAGMLTSMLMFASFTLLFQPTAHPPRLAQVGEGSGIETPGADVDDSALLTVVPNSDGQHELVAAIAANLRQFYYDRAIGQQLAEALLVHDRQREYESLDFFPELAARINMDIQAASRALGVPRGVFVADVVFSARPLPAGPLPMMTTEARERNHARILQQNCLVETAETLSRNVAYLKLTGFADATACREMTDRMMASLNDAAALIVDLRNNGGGFGETALQIAGYLFDRPTFMYDPRPNSPVPAETGSPIARNKLADKPVYILTSSRTQSAAEYFVYNLKMLNRVTVVGETTAGRQHSGAFRRISDHFGMGIQEVAPPDNPYPVKGWEIIGVEPDVKVPSAEAFDAAIKLATKSTSIRY